MNKQQTAAEILLDGAEREKAIKRIFESEDGKKLWFVLTAFCLEGIGAFHPDKLESAYYEGRRSVFFTLLDILGKNKQGYFEHVLAELNSKNELVDEVFFDDDR